MSWNWDDYQAYTTKYHVGDYVRVISDLQSQRRYIDEVGYPIRASDLMVRDWASREARIRGIGGGSTKRFYLLEGDDSGANGGSGWHFCASMLEPVDEGYVEVCESDLMEVLDV